jgi:hypothetical protein
MNKKKNKVLLAFFIALHAVWMMFITYIWLNMPYSYESESKIMTFTSIFKNVLLDLEDKPSRDSFLFVNVSYDKMLIPHYDADGFEAGKIAVTDRAPIIKFLETINKEYDYKFIILDIFFEDSTSYDSSLQVQINKSKGLILPYHLDDGDTILKSYVKGWKGLADYDTDYGTFLKYRYLQKDSFQTVPLQLYEKFNHGYLHKTGPFYTSEGHLALNAVSLDLPIRSYDIFSNDSSGYSSVHLCELLNTPPEFIRTLTKNKIIVIGDFLDRDIHPTLYGNTPGPLIQLNAYLTLVSGNHFLRWPILLFMFVNYVLISWFLFTGEILLNNKFINKIRKGSFGIPYDFIKYVFFLILMNLFGYLFFNIHLNVLIIGIYIVVVERVITFVKTKF